MKYFPIYVFLSFPLTLVLYIILFTSNLEYSEEIVINSNINKVINLHEDSTYMNKYINGFINYNLISGDLRQEGAVSELTVLFSTKDPVTRKIIMKEKIISNNLPSEKKIILSTLAIENTIKYRFVKLTESKTMFVREHKYNFTRYMKVKAFFMSSTFKRQSRMYLQKFKEFVEDQNNIRLEVKEIY